MRIFCADPESALRELAEKKQERKKKKKPCKILVIIVAEVLEDLRPWRKSMVCV